MKLLVFIFLVTLLSCIESLKILVFYPFPARSLSQLGDGAVRHFLEAGHEVTYVTVYPLKNPPKKNFRQIDISKNIELFADDEKISIGYIVEQQQKDTDVHYVQQIARDNARQTFQNENVKKLLQDTNEHFDVVFGDLFESEAYAGLAVLYDCPMIWLYSMGAHWQVLRLIDEGKNPAYDPDYLSADMLPLTFLERVKSLWARVKWQYYKTFETLPIEREIYEQAIGPLLAKRGRPLPDYEDVIYNASFIFGNEHNAIKNRPSTPQNFKHIGGFHIQDPITPLPKDLQDLMDNAKHGVIYFSMGSLWQSKALPKSLIRGLLQIFGELKQTVIWKFEDDLKDLPKNVHIVHWAPQRSILAHPNCKFFISHGGLLSSIETIHFGVPIIGIPVLFDQFHNVYKGVANGYAIGVTLNFDLPKNLKAAIDVMLNDQSYAKNAKELSLIYHDRPTKAGAELVHWVEHVVRTRGAPHLRSPALHVPLYQRLYLDLIAVVVGILALFLYALSSLFKKSPKKKLDNKKKN